MNHRELWNMGGAPLLIKATAGLLFWYPLLILFYVVAGAAALLMMLADSLSSRYFGDDL